MDTDPVMTEHAATFDRAAPTYDRVGVAFFSTFGRMLVDAAGVVPGESVLDVRTGRGAVLGQAAAAVGPSGGPRIKWTKSGGFAGGGVAVGGCGAL